MKLFIITIVIAVGGFFAYYHEVLADPSQKSEPTKKIESSRKGGETINIETNYQTGVSEGRSVSD